MTIETETAAKSLASGAPLTTDTWNDFVARLRNDCVGKGVEDHYTANAVFWVREKTKIYGVSRDYTDNFVITVDDREWFDVGEFWASLSEDQQQRLQSLAQEEYGQGYESIEESDKLLLIEKLRYTTVYGYVAEWKTVNFHFTQAAADAYIASNQRNHEGALLVFVESQDRCHEFNAIKEAILSGRLVLAAEEG